MSSVERSGKQNTPFRSLSPVALFHDPRVPPLKLAQPPSAHNLLLLLAISIQTILQNERRKVGEIPTKLVVGQRATTQALEERRRDGQSGGNILRTLRSR